jgi:hypothetical protein
MHPAAAPAQTRPPDPLQQPIAPIAPDDLARAHLEGRWDARTRELLAAEFAHLGPWFAREEARHRPPALDAERLPPGVARTPEAVAARDGTLMGLAISGGGIRSATFALGALQLLAREGLLQRFDYLSTVSGGGYIGSALTWWRTRGTGCGLGRTDFPFGTEDPSDVRPGSADDRQANLPPAQRSANFGYATPQQRDRLRFLRRHGNYLTPGGGLNLVAAAAVALRGVILALLASLVLMTLAMIVPLLIPDVLYYRVAGGDPSAVAQQWVLGSLQDALRFHTPWLGVPWLIETVLGPAGTLPPVFELALWLAALIGAGLLAGSVAYSLLTFLLRYLGFTRSSIYWFRRAQELCLWRVYLLMAIPLVLGATALAGEAASDNAGLLGSSGMLAGLGTGVWTFLRNQGGKVSGVPLALVATVGALLLLFGGLVVSYEIAGWLIAHDNTAAWVGGFAGLGAFYLVVVNLNHVSIHRLYRDRLMEAFLPDPAAGAEQGVPAAYAANKAPLSGFWDAAEPSGPYHLINANVVLVGSRERTWRLRGGDSFLLSPLLAGSNATGWTNTRQFDGNRITLATAMAISGAAANPNSGPGGAGLTRNLALSVLMSVLGISLGYWARHPRERSRWRLPPNHLRPGLRGIVPGNLHEQATYLQLSDGGHFENLAVYELIRRRVRLILLCDGAADPGFAFEDLQVLIRRIEADFGAQIFFDPFNRLELLIPVEDAAGAATYPVGVRMARQGHIVGEIRYCDGSRGVLVYLKTTVVEGISLKTKGYKGAHPDFPDETTADQFFDEDQFEAYRELGYRLAERMVRSAQFAAAGSRGPGLQALMECVEAGGLG